MSEATSYEIEVMASAATEHATEIDGYGEYRCRYLFCWLKETQKGKETHVITIYNETENRPVEHFTGTTRWLSSDHDEAEHYYTSCLYPKARA